jgi:hypothetical protein
MQHHGAPTRQLDWTFWGASKKLTNQLTWRNSLIGGSSQPSSRPEWSTVSLGIDKEVTPKSAPTAQILPVHTPRFARLEIEGQNTKATLAVAFSFGRAWQAHVVVR